MTPPPTSSAIRPASSRACPRSARSSTPTSRPRRRTTIASTRSSIVSSWRACRRSWARSKPRFSALPTAPSPHPAGSPTARDRVAFVNITELDAGIAGVPVSLLSPLNAELRGDDVTLKDLFVRVGSGRLTASGQWNTRLDGNFRAQFAGDFQDAIRLGKAFGVPASIDGSRRDAVRPAEQRQPARHGRHAGDQERHLRLGRRGVRGAGPQHQRGARTASS